MRPSEETLAKVAEISSIETPHAMPVQLWRQNESCPEGTVPILRVQRPQLLNISSLENYGRKPWHGVVKQDVASFNSSYPMVFSKQHEVRSLDMIPQFLFIHLCLISSFLFFHFLVVLVNTNGSLKL